MKRLLLPIFTSGLMVSSSAAVPVEPFCNYVGLLNDYWGKLQLTVDLDAARVRIVGRGSIYQDQDGVFSPIITG